MSRRARIKIVCVGVETLFAILTSAARLQWDPALTVVPLFHLAPVLLAAFVAAKCYILQLSSANSSFFLGWNNDIVKQPKPCRVRSVCCLLKARTQPKKAAAAQPKTSRSPVSNRHGLTGTDYTLHIRLWCNSSCPIHSDFNSHGWLSATRTRHTARQQKKKRTSHSHQLHLFWILLLWLGQLHPQGHLN